jgi:superfamily II DNA or RNA helicase
MGFEKKGRKFIPKPMRTYAAATRDRKEFSFHRNQLEALKFHLFRTRFFTETEVTIIHHGVVIESYPRFDFKVKHMFPPRENQPAILEYVLDNGILHPKWDAIIKMVALQTGKGKTYIAQYCMNELKLRTAIHFKGGYVERWKGDLEKTFEFKRGELLIVRGSKDLIALMNMHLEGTLKAQVIIITTATMRDYFKNYEESNGRSTIYPIKPIDFYPTLGIGFRVGDEIHQEFHNNFKIDLYTHVFKSLSLSATMESSDQFKNKMYAIAYPPNQRHDGGGYDAYIAVTAYMYNLDEETRIKYMGAQGYSHIVFEESIMRSPPLLKAYLAMIDKVVYQRFLSSFQHGQKMLIFCASIDLCTIVVDRFRKKYPEFDTVRYVGSLNDPYDELLECDIGVTTIGSGGTAIDLANLRVSLMTTAIDSRQSNEQVLGRTRRLKDFPEIVPEFVYFVCRDIEQHIKYDNNKRDFFKGKVVEHGIEISGVYL